MTKICDVTAAGGNTSLKNRVWHVRAADASVTRSLKAKGIPAEMAEILSARGLEVASVDDYLDPKLRNLLPDPSRFKDMDIATRFLADRLDEGGSLGIWSDYDCDGVTSAAILGRFFKMIGREDVVIRIPDRITEGYGPNTKGLLSMKEAGIDTVCILDSGIVAFDPLSAAAEAGLNVIVIDHHIAEDTIPKAVGVINANRKDEEPGFEHLCAAGMVFVFCVSVARELKKRGWFDGREGRPAMLPDLMSLLSIVALGTVADVVPLKTLNRAFVTRGLEMINEGSFVGFDAMRIAAKKKLTDKVTAMDLGWVFGPRINAGGRISDAMIGVKLLMTDDKQEATKLAEQLDKINAERKSVEETVTEQALEQFSDRAPGEDRRIAIAIVPDAHEGVVGISAGRLKEAYDCPAIVLAQDHDGNLKGSARSVPGFDIGHAIIEARNAGLIVKGGGHGMAGGLTLTRDQLPAFEAFMNAEIEKSEYFRSGVVSEVDIELKPAQLKTEVIDALARMEPFGTGNPSPTVALLDAEVKAIRIMKEKHLKVSVGAGQGTIDVMLWNVVGSELGDFLQNAVGRSLDFLGEPGINEWNGSRKVQMIAKDVRVASGVLI